MRAHFVFEFALMQAQSLGQSQTDPRLIPDLYKTHPKLTKYQQNDTKLFQQCPQTRKNDTILELQLNDIAAQVHQNV